MIELPFSAVAEYIEKDLANLVDNTRLDLLDALKQKTPVNTGTARAGWKIEGDDIVNDVEYSGYIETGTINTRPVGMVATTLLEVDNIVKKNITD